MQASIATLKQDIDMSKNIGLNDAMKLEMEAIFGATRSSLRQEIKLVSDEISGIKRKMKESDPRKIRTRLILFLLIIFLN